MTQDALRYFSISTVSLPPERRCTAICEGRKISLSCFLKGQADSCLDRWSGDQGSSSPALSSFGNARQRPFRCERSYPPGRSAIGRHRLQARTVPQMVQTRAARCPLAAADHRSGLRPRIPAPQLSAQGVGSVSIEGRARAVAATTIWPIPTEPQATLCGSAIAAATKPAQLALRRRPFPFPID